MIGSHGVCGIGVDLPGRVSLQKKADEMLDIKPCSRS